MPAQRAQVVKKSLELFEKVLAADGGKERADGVRRSSRELKSQAQAKDLQDKVHSPLKASVVFREIVSTSRAAESLESEGVFLDTDYHLWAKGRAILRRKPRRRLRRDRRT